MKKILVIGNSFGVDATRYLYGIARAAGNDLKVVTLHIGGCTLYRHYRNMKSGAKAYAYYINGFDSGLKVNLEEALLSDEWNVVTFQESSTRGGDPETYEPYLSALTAYVRELVPEAKQYFHETWSFAEDCPRFGKTHFQNRSEMLPALRRAYDLAEEAHGFFGVIPCLDAMNRMYSHIGPALYRDGFHCDYGIGRYLTGLVWFAALYHADVRGNSYRDFDAPISRELIGLAQRIAMEAIGET